MHSELRGKENTLASLAALYPEAFAMAIAVYTRSVLALRCSENAGSKFSDITRPDVSPGRRD